MRKLLIAALSLGMTAPASAAMIDVYAQANSSTGGVGAFAGLFVAGDALTVSVDEDDLWNAGPLPRWSNADGLVVDLFATGSDDSGYAAGTQIGTVFGNHSQFGYLFPFGALVGEIGGVYMLLGTSFDGTAWASGALNLYYWDSNSFDNTEFVTVSVNEAPADVPAPAALGLLGLGLAGLALRRRS